MSCFKFPKSFCAEVDGLMSRFWWAKTGKKRNIDWKKLQGLNEVCVYHK
jgi:hypothetical protein